MATGDTADFLFRLRSLLPDRWFPTTAPGAASATPMLDGVLSAPAAAYAYIYSLIAFAKAQMRMATATGIGLDMIAVDYFGLGLPRKSNESDLAYLRRIKAELLRPRATRAAVIKALTDLTGRVPKVFEPSRATDTGGYGNTGMTAGTGLGYGVAGGYGCLLIPFQAFITAYRPAGGGVAAVAPYGVLDASGLYVAGTTAARASTGWYRNAAGTWILGLANTLRVDYSTGVLALLQEPTGTNQVRNALSEGSTPGTPGVMPTNFTVTNTTGLSSSVVGSGSESGLPYYDLRFFGTTTSDATILVIPEGLTTIAALNGQTWTYSQFAYVVAGSVTGISSINLMMAMRNSVPAFLANTPSTTLTLGAGPLGVSRKTATQTLGQATTAWVVPILTIVCPTTTAIDITLRLAVPTMEQTAAATSPITPPAGTPGVSTRATETLVITGQGQGGLGFGAFEYVGASMIAAAVSDADIFATTAKTMPAAATAWTQIQS